MKRSWREKLAPECANLLDAYHDLKSLVRLDDFNEYVRTQRFSWEETVGEQMLPHRVRFAVRVWDLQRYIPRLILRFKDREFDFSSNAWSIWPRKILADFIGELKIMEFGSKPLDDSKCLLLAAQCFSVLAEICRGRVPQLKGKANVERAELTNLIFEHERRLLSWKEILDALQYARVNVPEDPEALRLWVWRAERERLVRPRRKAKRRGTERGGKAEP